MVENENQPVKFGQIFQNSLQLFQTSPQPLLIGGGIFFILNIALNYFWQDTFTYDWPNFGLIITLLSLFSGLFLAFFIPLALNRYYQKLIKDQKTSLQTIPSSLRRFWPVFGVRLFYFLTELILLIAMFAPLVTRFWQITSPFFIDLGRYFQSHNWTADQLDSYLAQQPELFGSDQAIVDLIINGIDMMKKELIYTFFMMIFVTILSVFLKTRFYFSTLICTTQDKIGPLESFRRSWQITDHHFWLTFTFILLNSVFFTFGGIIFGLGYIFVHPFCRCNDLYCLQALESAEKTKLSSKQPISSVT